MEQIILSAMMQHMQGSVNPECCDAGDQAQTAGVHEGQAPA